MDNRTVSREEEFERKLHRMERIGLLVLSGVSVLAAVYVTMSCAGLCGL